MDPCLHNAGMEHVSFSPNREGGEVLGVKRKIVRVVTEDNSSVYLDTIEIGQPVQAHSTSSTAHSIRATADCITPTTEPQRD